VDVPAFAMSVKVGSKNSWQTIEPTTEWKSMKTSIKKADLDVDLDRYYVDVEKL
jgi:hypothetical protein